MTSIQLDLTTIAKVSLFATVSTCATIFNFCNTKLAEIRIVIMVNFVASVAVILVAKIDPVPGTIVMAKLTQSAVAVPETLAARAIVISFME